MRWCATIGAVIEQLREIVGDRHVLTDPDVRAGYEVDWTGRYRGSTPAVVRPGNTDEVAAVVATCRERGAAIVPQGGNTGLVGGGVPLDGEVVLSLRRLQALAAVDERAAQVTAGAGVTLGGLQAQAHRAGLDVGLDLAARDSATIGGLVATNAGGVRLMRYGAMRAQLVGVEAVLGDGRVVSHLGGLLKDNTGYDLAGLLAGSEGTLGIVTVARVRLVPLLRHRVTALLGLATLDDAVDVVAAIRRDTPSLEAAEVMFEDGVRLVCDHLGVAPPFQSVSPVVLLLEAAGVSDPTADFAAAVDALAHRIDEVAVASEPARRAALWQYREGHTEAINTRGIPHKLDVTLPPATMAEFAARVREDVSQLASGATTYLFGHVGDGNLHVNVLGLPPDDDRVDDAVLRLTAALGGSISAEHGIGTAKRRWLHLNRSDAELAAFRATKSALDPDGVLNPGVLLP